MQATPASFVGHEARRLSVLRPPGSYLGPLAERDRDTWRDLDLALRMARHHLVEDAWPRLMGAFRAELAWRSRLIAELGVQAALSTLHPSISWAGPVMQIETLAELLGRTRAAVLSLALSERTTTELAREIGVSPAAVSAHTKALRAAGLLVSARAGKAVLHSATPLGSRLVDSARCWYGSGSSRPGA